MFCAYTRTRYQVSAYRTIGPLVNFPFLVGDVPRRPSDGVYIQCTINLAIVLYGSVHPNQN